MYPASKIPNKLISKLNKEINENYDLFIEKTEDVSGDDYKTMAELVQAYCWGLYNSRRIIFFTQTINGERVNSEKLSDKDVFTRITENIKVLKDESLQERIALSASYFEENSRVRNWICHYAIRKVLDEDVLLLLSADGRGSKDGVSMDKGENRYGFITLQQVRRVARDMVDKAATLAEVVPRIAKLINEYH